MKTPDILTQNPGNVLKNYGMYVFGHIYDCLDFPMIYLVECQCVWGGGEGGGQGVSNITDSYWRKTCFVRNV